MFEQFDKIQRNFFESLDLILKHQSLKNGFERITNEIQRHKKSSIYKIANEKISEYSETLNETRKFSYNAIIISLYGLLERTIKSLLNKYIQFAIEHPEYDINVMQKIVDKNWVLSLNSLERSTENSKNKILENLYFTTINNDYSKIIPDFVLSKNNNLKTDIIGRLCNELGIKNMLERIKGSYIFISTFQIVKVLDNYEKAEKTIRSLSFPFSEIDDLVERRNRVAHDGEEENMLAMEILINEYVPLLKSFVTAFYQFIIGDILSILKTNSLMVELIPIKIIDSHIICFNCEGQKLCINDYILIENENLINSSKVHKMQANNIDIINSFGQTKIGIELDKNCKENYKYFYIKNE